MAEECWMSHPEPPEDWRTGTWQNTLDTFSNIFFYFLTNILSCNYYIKPALQAYNLHLYVLTELTGMLLKQVANEEDGTVQ